MQGEIGKISSEYWSCASKKPRNIWGKSWKKQTRILPLQISEGTWSCKSWFQNLSFQNRENPFFHCSKLPSIWYFVTAALRNQYKYKANSYFNSPDINYMDCDYINTAWITTLSPWVFIIMGYSGNIIKDTYIMFSIITSVFLVSIYLILTTIFQNSIIITPSEAQRSDHICSMWENQCKSTKSAHRVHVFSHYMRKPSTSLSSPTSPALIKISLRWPSKT